METRKIQIRAIGFKQTTVEFEKSEKKNVKFHLLVLMATKIANKNHISPKTLAAIDTSKASQAIFDDLLKKVLKLFKALGGTDQVSKGNEFEPAVLELIAKPQAASKAVKKK